MRLPERRGDERNSPNHGSITIELPSVKENFRDFSFLVLDEFVSAAILARNPSGPCGPEFLISGNAKKVVLVVPIKREFFDDLPEWGPIPSVESEMALIRAYGSEVVALALNTKGANAAEIEAYRQEYQAKLGIPVVAPLEEGVDRIVEVLLPN